MKNKFEQDLRRNGGEENSVGTTRDNISGEDDNANELRALIQDLQQRLLKVEQTLFQNKNEQPNPSFDDNLATHEKTRRNHLTPFPLHCFIGIPFPK